MFGYVRAYRPYLRMCEFDTYKGVYCGLCRTIGKRSGLVPRFTLSYDFAFLAVMNLSLGGLTIKGEKHRCIAHPFRKIPCAVCENGFDYPADAAVILITHKLKDDLADKSAKGRLAAAAALPFFAKPYKNARERYPQLARTIEKMMRLQRKTEREKCSSCDIACEPTAMMMSEIAAGLTDDKALIPKLRRFGYLLGRFIYICDALDDLEEDHKNGGYNPLLCAYPPKYSGRELSRRDRRRICINTQQSIDLTLGALAEAYTALDIKMYKPVLDNIIYLGLKNVYRQICSGEFAKETKALPFCRKG